MRNRLSETMGRVCRKRFHFFVISTVTALPAREMLAKVESITHVLFLSFMRHSDSGNLWSFSKRTLCSKCRSKFKIWPQSAEAVCKTIGNITYFGRKRLSKWTRFSCWIFTSFQKHFHKDMRDAHYTLMTLLRISAILKFLRFRMIWKFTLLLTQCLTLMGYNLIYHF